MEDGIQLVCPTNVKYSIKSKRYKGTTLNSQFGCEGKTGMWQIQFSTNCHHSDKTAKSFCTFMCILYLTRKTFGKIFNRQVSL